MGVLHVKAIEKIHSITFKSFLIVNFRPYLPPKKCFSSILHRLLLYYLTLFDLDPQRLKSLKLSLSRFVIIYRTSTFRRETENIQHTAFFCHCNVTIVCKKNVHFHIFYIHNTIQNPPCQCSEVFVLFFFFLSSALTSSSSYFLSGKNGFKVHVYLFYIHQDNKDHPSQCSTLTAFQKGL